MAKMTAARLQHSSDISRFTLLAQAVQVVRDVTLETLVHSMELTDEMTSPEVPTIRGWLMDELERRDPAAFEAWIESNTESPRPFFIPMSWPE